MRKLKRFLATMLSFTFVMTLFQSASMATVVKAEEGTSTIPQSEITIVDVSSERPNTANLVLDGNKNTIWHTEWSPMANPPHWLTFDLGEEKDVFRVRYVPRQGTGSGDNNGIAQSYKIYVSQDGENFTEVAEGNWEVSKSEKSATFNSVKARYVKFEITSGVGNYGSAAEVNIDTNLSFVVDSSKLSDTIKAAKVKVSELGNLAENNHLSTAIAKAEEILNNGNELTTQETYDTAISELNNIMEAFEDLGEKTYFQPGEVWYDNSGVPIQAHGGGIMYDPKSEKYYWYGEERTEGYFNMRGVSVYSSTDLYNWENEGIAYKKEDAPEQFRGENNGINERPKVIYNEKTGKYVMWIHADDNGYKISEALVAISDSPVGPFTTVDHFRPITENFGYADDDYAEQNKRGGTYRDMNLFVDEDGTGYVIYSSEQNYTMYICRLNEEYTDIERVNGEPIEGKTWSRNLIKAHREAPAVFKHNGKYYMITSGATGWDPNQASYAVADSMLGPWTTIGDPCVGDNKTTFGSQSTFVIPVQGEPGKFIYMGDRWKSSDLADSRYIWLPLTVDNNTVKVEWKDKWSVDDIETSKFYPIKDITVNGKSLTGFSPDRLEYQVSILENDAGVIPEVKAVGIDGAEVTIKQATTLPGQAAVTAKSASGQEITYTIEFVVKTIADSMILKYDFNDGTATDITGNGFNGSLKGEAVIQEDTSNNSVLKLNGNSSYLEIPNGVLKDLNNITISTYAKWDQDRVNEFLFGLGIDSSKYIFVTPRGSGDKFRSAITTGSWSGEQSSNSGNRLATNQWKHIAVTLSGDTNTMTLYLDGVEVAKNTNVTIKPYQLYDSSKNYSGYIGKSFYSGDPYFRGLVDDFRVYDKALTANEISSLINESISNVDEVRVATIVGAYPELPTTVDTIDVYGSKKVLDVIWNEVNKDDYSKLGEFTVEGTIKGSTVKAMAKVKVMEQLELKSTAKTDSTIDLVWNGIENANSYRVYRSMESGSNYELIYEGEETNYVDSGLVTGKTYYYVLTYVDEEFESVKSEELSITTNLVKPNVPTGLTAKEVYQKAAVITWDEVPGADSYVLYRKDGLIRYSKVCEIEDTEYKDTDLEANKSYSYTVAAKNGAGESNKSDKLVISTILNDSIVNDDFRYDVSGNKIQAHGGDIKKFGDTYYWYGEDKTHNGASFINVSCYTSKDLINWEFSNNIISKETLDQDGNVAADLQDCKVERPKVIYNEKTKKYVMWGHYERSGDYGLAEVVVAVGDTPNGDFTYVSKFRPDNQESRDMTVFVDDDKEAYLFSSSHMNSKTSLYRLTDDYLSIEETLNFVYENEHREAPAVIKKDGTYYLITSGASGWYPNQAKYSTATEITGPWSKPQNIGNNSAFYSQSAFIFAVEGTEETQYILAGDRWRSSKLGDSTYVWMPLELDGENADIEYYDEFKLDVKTGKINVEDNGQLLSQGKTAKASNVASDSNPNNANDGDYDSRWLATDSSKWPAWWSVDLGEKCDISNVQVSWYIHNGSEAYYQYKIWVSDDDINYTLAYDGTNNKTYGFTSDKLSGIQGRYVKLELVNAVLWNNPNNWYTPQLYEVRVYGESCEAVTPVGLSSTLIKTGNSNNTTSVKLSWNADKTAAGYKLYRADKVNGDYEELYSGIAPSYTDSELKVDKDYYYKVSTVSSKGESPLSEPLKVTTVKVSDGALLIENGVAPFEGYPLLADGSIKVGDTYYNYLGVDCYSSKDLKNWTFENSVLTKESHEELKACKMESVSVRYNEKTDKYVLWMHYENDKDYTLGRVAVAVGDTPDGDFEYIRSFRPNDQDSRDLGFFVDDDGTGYLIAATNTNANLRLFTLSEDYLEIIDETLIYDNKFREAPHIVKVDGYYYLLTSGCSGWYPNQAMYSSATDIKGPWTEMKPLGDVSTFAGQVGGVVKVDGSEETSYVMRANRWWMIGGGETFNDSTQVWMPIKFNNGVATLEYYDEISVDYETGRVIGIEKGDLISQGKTATAKSEAYGYPASNILDGDYTTSWVAARNFDWPHWITIDLGEEYDLSSIQISWYIMNGSEGSYKYKIEGSTDGETFEELLDRTDNKGYGFTSDKLSGRARYVRVNMVNCVLQNNPNYNWYTPSLYEVKVYGNSVLPEDQDVVDVIKMINELPRVSEITLANKESIAAIRTAYNNLNVEQRKLVTNLKILVSAEDKVAKLESAKYRLETAVEVASKVSDEELDMVVPVVVKEFKDALVEAKKILANTEATKEQMDISFDRLSSVMQLLSYKKGDKTELQALANKINDLNSSEYFKETWDNIQIELVRANEVLGNENAMEDEVAEAYEKLLRAFLELRLKPSKEKLEELINNVEKLDANKYTEESWREVEKALSHAKLVFENEEATEEEIKEVEVVLDNAMNSLEEKVNEDELAAYGVIVKINEISEYITLAEKPKVEAARVAYNELTEVQKALVTNIAKLEAAEVRIAELESQAEEDKKVAQKVIDAINNLDVKTLKDKNDVENARRMYEGLTEAQKLFISQDVFNKLVESELKISELEKVEEEISKADKKAAEKVIKEIDKLPSKITLKNKKAVESARAAYNGLTEVQKALVTNLEKLELAENIILELEKLGDGANNDVIIKPTVDGVVNIEILTELESGKENVVEVDTKANKLKVVIKDIDSIKEAIESGTGGSITIKLSNGIDINVPFKAIDKSLLTDGAELVLNIEVSKDNTIVGNIKGVKKVYIFNLSVVTGDSSIVISNMKESKVNVTITLTDDELKSLDKSKLAVFYYNEKTKKFELMPTTVEGNKVTFETTHLSKFIIAEKADTSSGDTVLPQTGGVSTRSVLFLALVLILGGTVTLRRKKTI